LPVLLLLLLQCYISDTVQVSHCELSECL
jgi:hypothetical protein